ncbi:hypothetical protein GCM10022262_39800 [Georgenia daeguensis]|uniref:Uncharacterized protein n=1 Tax=Georgenia daeguensis TaxID=908355 RepID=A0ABP6ULM4_9MICO
MGGEDRQAGGDLRSVQVVHTADVGHFQDVLADLGEIQAGGGSLEQDVAGFAQDGERAGHDQDGDERAGQCVGPRPSRRGDDDGADDDRDRAEGVVDHLEERRPHVEVGAQGQC